MRTTLKWQRDGRKIPLAGKVFLTILILLTVILLAWILTVMDASSAINLKALIG